MKSVYLISQGYTNFHKMVWMAIIGDDDQTNPQNSFLWSPHLGGSFTQNFLNHPQVPLKVVMTRYIPPESKLTQGPISKVKS